MQSCSVILLYLSMQRIHICNILELRRLGLFAWHIFASLTGALNWPNFSEDLRYCEVIVITRHS